MSSQEWSLSHTSTCLQAVSVGSTPKRPSHSANVGSCRLFPHSHLVAQGLEQFPQRGLPNEINSIPNTSGKVLSFHAPSASLWPQELVHLSQVSCAHHYFWFNAIFTEILLNCVMCMTPSNLSSEIGFLLMEQRLILHLREGPVPSTPFPGSQDFRVTVTQLSLRHKQNPS